VLLKRFMIAGHELFISGSIGISCYPHDGTDADILLTNADAAMYQAKQQGRNGYRFYSAEMNTEALEALTMSNSLRMALERNELILHYQPRIELASGRITGMEALVRWQHPERGMIPPGKFIPLAEETGMIEAIGEWVLRTACRQAKAWQDAGLSAVAVAVNISARQFRHDHFAQRIAAILSETELEARFLEVEITESMMMQDHERTERVLAELHMMGITIAVDDFGTGYSSLAYLKRFPIDCLKIDQSFVRDLPGNLDDLAITKAIITLAKSLKLEAIAEGVETVAQHAFLASCGCDEAQGYLFSKPLPAMDMEALLRSQQSLRISTAA
jgi:EAL domain-containing protein (putative c-di-GMP-specific phosphodiesterase class I)